MNLLPEPALPLPKPNTKTYGGNAAFHNFNNDYSHIVNPNLRRRLALSEIDKVCKTLEFDLKPCYSMEAVVSEIMQAFLNHSVMAFIPTVLGYIN